MIEPPSQTTDWHPGDEAIIIDGEWSGRSARVMNVNQAEGKVVVSLRLFSEERPLEISLRQLERPTSPQRQWKRAIIFSSIILISGPTILLVYVSLLDFFTIGRLPSLHLLELAPLLLSCPFYISAFIAAWIGFHVLTGRY